MIYARRNLKTIFGHFRWYFAQCVIVLQYYTLYHYSSYEGLERHYNRSLKETIHKSSFLYVLKPLTLIQLNKVNAINEIEHYNDILS